MRQLNLPNKLTLFRIFVVPVIIVFLVKPSALYSFLAAVVFSLAAVTDWLDGHLARSTGQVTTLGKLLDPIADKILIVSVLVPLVGLGRVPAWLATVIIGRELAVGGIRSMAAAERLIIPAGRLGKFKTGFEIAAMEFLLLNWDFRFIDFQTIGMLCLMTALVFSLTSGMNYFLVYWRTKEAGAA